MAIPSSNVKSLIRRFEILASYSSVPNVRSEFLVSPTYQVQRQQQGRPHTQLGDIQELEGVEGRNNSEIHRRERTLGQKQIRRSSSEVGLMSTSGYLGLPSLRPQGMVGNGSALQPPAGSAVKPRSLYNTLTRADTFLPGDTKGSHNGPAKLTAGMGDDSVNKADCSSAMHCTSASRLALRRLGQSVKRKASFFIEQSLKQDNLPIRKSPPPKRLFGVSGENMGRNVSRKVMGKLEGVRRVSEDGRRSLVLLSRSESNREGEKRSSGDGTDDNTLTGTVTEEVMLSLARERSLATETEREWVGTELSSSWSSTSYPLIRPTTPPVMREMPSKFIHSLLRRSLKPPAAIDGPAASGGNVAYKGGPRRAPEIKQVPTILKRGNSSTATFLAVGGSKPGSIAEQGSPRHKKSRKPWRNWSGASRKGMDGAGEVDDMYGSGTIRKKRITPPKVSVRSLIARFRQAESVGKTGESDLGVYKLLNRESGKSVEVQFDEENDEDWGGGSEREGNKRENGSFRKKPKRSVSIRTFLGASSGAREQQTRSATFTFLSEQATGDKFGTHTEHSGHSRHDQKQPKPYLHPGNGTKSFMLKIAPKNEELGETSEEAEDISNYNERKSSERGNIGAMTGPQSGTDGSKRKSGEESSKPEFSLPSLTSTDTIVTTKNSSARRQSYTSTSDDEMSQENGGTRGYHTTANKQLWSRSSGEINYGYISSSESGRWYKIPEHLGPAVEGPMSMASMGAPIRQGLQQLIQPVYRYQAYQPPKPLQPIVVYDVDVQGQIGNSNMGRAGRSKYLEAYRGTPAPEGFISRRRTGKRQELSEEEESGSFGSEMSGEGMSQDGKLEDDERDSSPATDELGYVYVDDDEVNGQGTDGELSNSDSDHYTEVGSIEEYEEREEETSDHEECTAAGETALTSTTREMTLSAQRTSLPCGGDTSSELELTPPLVLNNYANTKYHHHKRHLGSTSQQANGVVTRPLQPVHGDPEPPRTASAARRMMRQHEAAMKVVGTILFDGVNMLNQLDDIEVMGFGYGSSSRGEGLDKGREWEELMEEEESEEVVRVKLPVKGIPISGRVVQPKAKNYVMRVAIEKFVLASG
ncbi:hypothetical protein L211DRAFT_869171 [Terfezia boudieri ATCC MYA-4762]|uniref:Uncharacterized protein n=1 Tax=Terfezia boudieri ATCC MYA-4762 TaxID=1051890 RepID=A0A3N4LPW0_9PEZI|nr:hypothetical protein L211DRAFT_869171 [Terfezia boudieri ATCC MYA-4762]